jgi:hypothetical protein
VLPINQIKLNISIFDDPAVVFKVAGKRARVNSVQAAGRSRRSPSGQTRHIHGVRAISACALIATELLHCGERLSSLYLKIRAT